MSTSSFSDLPSDMIYEIFTHLPVKSLLRLGCELSSDPYFISQHLRRSPPSILLNTYASQPHGHLLYSYGPRNDEPDNLHRFLHFPGSDNPFHHLEFLGSPNGIVCAVQYKDSRDFTLWNPATRATLRLPAPALVFDPTTHRRACVGLGFYPSSGDYKIIRILERIDYKLPDEVEILSVNLGRWTRLMSDGSKMLMTHRSKIVLRHLHSLVAKGVPYWRSTKVDSAIPHPAASGKVPEKLVWFDGRDDSFRVEEFAWPTEKFLMQVGVMDDCLCALVVEEDKRGCGVWVKEGEGTAGWSKKYRLATNPNPRVLINNPLVHKVLAGFNGPKAIMVGEIGGDGLKLRICDLERRQIVGEINLEEALIHPNVKIRVLGYTESLTQMPKLGI